MLGSFAPNSQKHDAKCIDIGQFKEKLLALSVPLPSNTDFLYILFGGVSSFVEMSLQQVKY